jgi:hypothetical protein
MKIKMILPLTMAGMFAATTVSAQTVIDSFDNMVDQILGTVDGVNTDAAFLSSAVNIEEVTGSIDISSSASNTPGSSIVEGESLEITIDNLSATSLEPGGILGLGINSIDGSGSFTDTTGGTTDTFAAVTQSFGDLTTVAAGAINDGTANLTETAADASVNAEAISSSTSTSIESLNNTGSTIGSANVALNTALIDGSVVANMTDTSATVGAISTTAAGAINTSDVTATFIGTGAEADAVLP